VERGRWEGQNFQLGSSAPGRRRLMYEKPLYPHFHGLCIFQWPFANWPNIIIQKACIFVNTPHHHCWNLRFLFHSFVLYLHSIDPILVTITNGYINCQSKVNILSLTLRNTFS
jgi:hypothetical protein